MMLSDRVLCALGDITVSFEALDQRVQFVSWVLLVGNQIENQRFGRAATAGLSFARRVDLLETLLRLRAPEHPSLAAGGAMDGLMRKIRALEGRRNNYVHSVWFHRDDDSAIRTKTTARGELAFQSEEVSVAALEALASELKEATEAIIREFLNMTATPPPTAA